MYVYVQLIHDLPTQHCKAIILQFKKKKKKAYLKKKNLPQYWGCGFDPWSGNAACEPQLLSAHTHTRRVLGTESGITDPRPQVKW